MLRRIYGSRNFCHFIRRISTSSKYRTAYDNDGKTTVTVLNDEPGSSIMINSYSVTGFRLNNGMFVVGPMVVFPKTVVNWNINDDSDICKESLSLFTLLEPKLDILVIGYSNPRFERSKLDKELLALRHKYRMNIEILPVEKAVSTYNFLAVDGRWVAGALIPPFRVDLIDADIMTTKQRDIDPQLIN